MIVLWLILAAVVVLAAVVLVRTARFMPGTAPAVPEGEETIDRDKAVENLRTLSPLPYRLQHEPRAGRRCRV